MMYQYISNFRTYYWNYHFVLYNIEYCMASVIYICWSKSKFYLRCEDKIKLTNILCFQVFSIYTIGGCFGIYITYDTFTRSLFFLGNFYSFSLSLLLKKHLNRMHMKKLASSNFSFFLLFLFFVKNCDPIVLYFLWCK